MDNDLWVTRILKLNVKSFAKLSAIRTQWRIQDFNDGWQLQPKIWPNFAKNCRNMKIKSGDVVSPNANGGVTKPICLNRIRKSRRIHARGESEESVVRRRGSTQAKDPPWLWNPGQISPEVQNRGIVSKQTIVSCVLQKFYKKKKKKRIHATLTSFSL